MHQRATITKGTKKELLKSKLQNIVQTYDYERYSCNIRSNIPVHVEKRTLQTCGGKILKSFFSLL
jgi:hypothetical protein